MLAARSAELEECGVEEAARRRQLARQDAAQTRAREAATLGYYYSGEEYDGDVPLARPPRAASVLPLTASSSDLDLALPSLGGAHPAFEYFGEGGLSDAQFDALERLVSQVRNARPHSTCSSRSPHPG